MRRVVCARIDALRPHLPDQVRYGRLDYLVDYIFCGYAKSKVAKQTVFQVVYPAVHGELLTSLPGAANKSCTTNVRRLLDGVQLANALGPFIEIRHSLEGGSMLQDQVLDNTQPVVDQAEFSIFQGRTDPSAFVVATHDDVLYLQYVHRVLNDREAVQIGMNDEVPDVSMHEHVAGREIDNLVCGNATVSASDP